MLYTDKWLKLCVRAYVHACVRACMCQYRCVPDSTLLLYHDQDAKSSYTVMIDSHIVLLCIQLLFLTYTTQKLLDENTPIGAYSIIYVNLHGYVYFICWWSSNRFRWNLYGIWLSSLKRKRNDIQHCSVSLDNAYCCYPKYLTGKYGCLEVANICIRYYK